MRESDLDQPGPSDSSAAALEVPLRRLACLSGSLDRGLAVRLRRLRRGGSYVRLGFARFADFARERVGLASRTAQELVRLAEGLERLPLLDGALRQGSIGWTAALQVVRVAGLDDQSEWISLARRCSVRELKHHVRLALARRDQPSPSNGRRAVESTEPGGVDEPAVRAEPPPMTLTSEKAASTVTIELDTSDRAEDPLRRLRVATSGSTACLWDASLELCELVAGSSLGLGEAPEYVLADFLSGASRSTQPRPRCDSRGAPVVPLGSRPPRFGVVAGSGSVAGSGVAAGRPGPLGDPLAVALSAHVVRALELVESQPEDDPFEIDASLQVLAAARTLLELDLARLLRRFEALGLARRLGFDRFGDYTAERLGMSADRASFLVRLDRQLARFPEVLRAVRDGSIGTVAALLVCRVAVAGRSERVWVERARRCTVLRLRREVAWAERESRYWGLRVPMPPPPGRIPSALEKLTQRLTEREEREEREEPKEEPKEEQEQNQEHRNKEICHDEIHGERNEQADFEPAEAAAEETTALRPEVDAAWIGRWSETFAPDQVCQGAFRVEFFLCQSALELWEEARDKICEVSGGSEVSDGRVLHEVALAFLGTHLPLWLEQVRYGDPIAVRDRFECQIPGCTSRAGAAHHIWFRSQGGPDEWWNLLFVCLIHHLEAIHRGYVRVSGRAPDELVIELGVRPDGTALETFVRGERSVSEERWNDQDRPNRVA